MNRMRVKNHVRLLMVLLLVWPAFPLWAAEAKAVFDIMEYRVEGNSVLPDGKIEQAVYAFMGEGKSIDDVELARTALEKAFHDAGYLTVLVNIPEQNVESGLVRLEVVEGRVEKLRVLGSRYYALGKIKGRVAEFGEGNVPYFPEVQKQMAGINSTPDRQVTPVMRPGKSPGKVEVDLKVQDKLPFHGGIELNNRYSPNTTQTRLNGSMRYDNLWQLDHSIGISFQLTPENTDETKVLSATYMIPTGGDYWVMYGVLSKSNVSAVGDVNIIGNGNIYGLRYIHPLPPLKTYTHSLTLGVDYKDFKETTALLGADSFNTPIAYTPFNIGYDATLQGKNSTTQMNLGVTFSIRGLGNDAQQFADKRYLAQSNFAYVRADFKHTQTLFKDWSFFANFTGQVANSPLISSEQFAIGGADSVRGYLESNSLGDQGVTAKFELRTPPLAKYLSDKINDLQALVFYDAGYVSIQSPLANQTEQFRLSSVGIGLHLKGWHGLFGALDFAHALHSAGQVRDGDNRLHFRVGYDW
ncbi:MAG: ShlB/FhaC/HecB family hemolysin secretion/activation protein [Methylophilaceae bacterium]|nr:ShlB/FhaC/HecB family hemolysin secretion/activation protein [Methylophilaceae bacterium]